MPPIEFALLALLARRARDGRPGLSRQQAGAEDAAEFLQIYLDLPGASTRTTKDKVRRDGLSAPDLGQRVSRIGARLDKALGPGRARPYRINTLGPRARSCYALALEPEQIRFGKVNEE